MLPIKVNKIILILIAGFSFLTSARCAELPAAGEENHIYFEADNFLYNKQTDTMYLKGNVKIIEKFRPNDLPDRITKAEEFIINPKSGILKSPGAVVVEEKFNAIYGERGYLNRNTGETSLENVSASYGSWRILEAKKAEITDTKHIYKGVKLTNCQLEDHHYHIKFSKTSIIPKKRIFGYNGILFIKKIPIFYFPFIYRSLGTDKRYITYLDFGYDERSGTQIKSTTVYKFNEIFRSKFYLDYFTKLTWGTGLGFQANKPGKIDFNIDGYRIKEPGSSLDRWGLTGGYNFNIKDTLAKSGSGYNLYSQSRFRLVSDPLFNNDFFRSNPYAVSPDNNADISVVHQTKKTITRISYIKNQTRLDDETFIDTSESRPKFDFSMVPFKIFKLPFLNTFGSSFESTKIPEIGYYKKTARARYGINKTIPVTRGLSVLPSVFYDQEIIFSPKNDEGTGYKENQWIGRWGTGFNVRKYFKSVTVDVAHSYIKRLRTNKITPDTTANDYGTEQNLITISNFIRPNRKVYVRLNTGFDLRDERDKYKDFSTRTEPIFFDFYYTPKKNIKIALQNRYKPKTGNQAFVMQSTLGDEEKTHWNLGFANYKTNPSDYFLNTNLVWKPYGKSWYIDIGFGAKAHITAKSTARDVVLYSKRFMLYKAFHDFYTTLTFRVRPGVKSAMFNVGLRFEEPTKRIPSERERERFKTEWEKEDKNPQGL